MAVNQQFSGVHLQTPRCLSCQSASGPRDWIRQKPDVSRTPGNGADGHRHDHESVAAMTLFLPPQHGCWPSCHWFALHLQATKQIPENNTTINIKTCTCPLIKTCCSHFKYLRNDLLAHCRTLPHEHNWWIKFDAMMTSEFFTEFRPPTNSMKDNKHLDD